MLRELELGIDTDVRVSAPEVPRVPLRERAAAIIRRLDERHPQIRDWLGGRLDIGLPALAASVALHLSLMIALAFTGLRVYREANQTFESATVPVDTSLDSLDLTQYQDIDQSDKLTMTPAAGSFAPELATVNVVGMAGGPVSPVASADAAPAALARLDIQRASELVVPTATMLGQSVSIKGNGAEHVGTAEGAIDRLANEILRRLEADRTLVVWVFDSSLSLQGERDRLAKHVETIYSHINQLDQGNRAANGGLLSTVVAYGQGRKTMLDAPTADADSIASAIRSITLMDDTGLESTFTTVAQAAEKWGHYRDHQGNRYRAMIIVVTDEVGDDENNLEAAIEAAAKVKAPVYVLGSQAIFARAEGRMNYTDPKTGRTYFNLPVRQGPESIMPEQIRLPYWYAGNQYDILDSGFGPYALSRLAGATEGIFFVTRLGQTRMGFDPQAMREYKPDWISRARYEASLEDHPIRRAVLAAARITQENNLPSMPSLLFPPADGEEFKEAMERNQALAARTAYTVDAALEPIMAVVKERDREPSRRWQAHYDLIRGRLMAVKVRCYEYNWICAAMKKDPLKFQNPANNAWRLVSDPQVHYSDKAAAAGEQAFAVLRKVVEDHPNTPWALLAARELKDPLGFRWVEARVQPPQRRPPGDNAARKNAERNMPKPTPPPRL